MEVLTQKVGAVVEQITKAIRRGLEALREKLDGFLNRYPVYDGLVYTQQEEELIDQTVEIVCNFFPESPGHYLVEEDYESRCEAVEDFGNQLIECYGLDGVDIIITDDAQRFSEKDAIYLFGYASISEHKIYINANYLRLDEEDALEHIASTLIHELRHMIQYQIASLDRTYGVPYERRHLWRYNMMHYIEPEYDMEGYITQPIEFDARNFTNRIWQQAYHKRITQR